MGGEYFCLFCGFFCLLVFCFGFVCLFVFLFLVPTGSRDGERIPSIYILVDKRFVCML